MPNGYGNLSVLATSACLPLAEEVTRHLGQPYSLGRAFIGAHRDGECRLEILENIRSKDVFLIASGQQPDRNLIELLWMLEAIRSSAAGRITLVMPYFPYSRSDKAEEGRREPIGAALVARMVETAGADHCILMDLHNSAITGFFQKAVCDRIHATMVLVPRLKQLLEGKNYVIASPDAGGVPRALKFAEKMGQEGIVYFSKARSAPGEIKQGSVNISSRVDGQIVVLVDDIIDSGGTMIEDTKAALDAGASSVIAVAPHAVFSEGALARIEESPLEMILTTDSIPRDYAGQSTKVTAVSISALLARAITNVHAGLSLKELRDLQF